MKKNTYPALVFLVGLCFTWPTFAENYIIYSNPEVERLRSRPLVDVSEGSLWSQYWYWHNDAGNPGNLTMLEHADYLRAAFGCYFDHTLIAGASVSSGFPHGRITPAGEYVTQFLDAGEPVNIAAHGRMARHDMMEEIQAYLTRAETEAREDRTKSPVSALFGMDLFFWDADSGPKAWLHEGTCEDSENTLRELITQAKTSPFLLFLATIPNAADLSLPVIQSEECKDGLNQVIRDECNGRCMYLDAQTMVSDITSNGQLTYRDVTYTEDQLLFDGLHFSERAQLIIAHSIIEALGRSVYYCYDLHI